MVHRIIRINFKEIVFLDYLNSQPPREPSADPLARTPVERPRIKPIE